MDTSDLERYRAHLLALREELRSLSEGSRESTQPVILDQASVGRLSRMDAIQGQQMAQESERRRKQRLLAIEGALRRIESGDYGYCHVCDEEIDPRRLEFDPTSTRCIRCQQA